MDFAFPELSASVQKLTKTKRNYMAADGHKENFQGLVSF